MNGLTVVREWQRRRNARALWRRIVDTTSQQQQASERFSDQCDKRLDRFLDLMTTDIELAPLAGYARAASATHDPVALVHNLEKLARFWEQSA
jgi:uncharacterized membrane protein YccC